MTDQAAKDLFAAIVAGAKDVVDDLLQSNPHVAAARDGSGVSAILLALYHGQTDIARRIHEARSELDVFEAAALGELDHVRALVEADSDLVHAHAADGFTPLHLAVFFQQATVSRYLLERGADADAIARNPSNVRPLHSAAASRNAEMIDILLGAGADPDARQAGGHTALHSAALHGNLAMARALLADGASPDLRNDDGAAAVDLAREAEADDVVRELESRHRG